MVNLAVNNYPQLVDALKKVLFEGFRQIKELRVKIYWQAGLLISDYIAQNPSLSGRGKGLFNTLSADLKIHKRTLEQTVKVYRQFPNANARSPLDWTHYRLLIGVGDEDKRKEFTQKATHENWTSRRLQDEIRLDRLREKYKDVQVEDEAGTEHLKTARGRLYSYKLIKPTLISPVENKFLVDLGFNVWKDIKLQGLANHDDSQIVDSVKRDDGIYRFRESEARANQIYTYKALVERVIDADTIILHIDLGFNSWIRQRVRFRGINAPELTTSKGEKAKEFVEETLANAPFVIIKTYSADKYGRYLADVFYSTAETDPQTVASSGKFLNQQLLDLGFARIV